MFWYINQTKARQTLFTVLTHLFILPHFTLLFTGGYYSRPKFILINSINIFTWLNITDIQIFICFGNLKLLPGGQTLLILRFSMFLSNLIQSNASHRQNIFVYSISSQFHDTILRIHMPLFIITTPITSFMIAVASTTAYITTMLSAVYLVRTNASGTPITHR